MMKIIEVNLAHEGVHDRQVGADAHPGDDPGDHELRVVRRQRVVERPEAGQRHRDHQHVAAADAVGDRAQHQRAHDVAGEVEHHRRLERLQRVLRRAARLEGHARLDERDVDVEDVVEGEQEAEPDHPDEEVGQRPGVDAVQPGEHVAWRRPPGGHGLVGGAHFRGLTPKRHQSSDF
jgi:hypothetical protein